MEREIRLILDDATVWQGWVKLGDKGAPASVQDFFAAAWAKALAESAVAPADAGRVQFRFV